MIFEISDLMFSDWVSFLAYPNLFGIKGFVVVVMDYTGILVSLSKYAGCNCILVFRIRIRDRDHCVCTCTQNKKN
jgi:hypothetical protein